MAIIVTVLQIFAWVLSIVLLLAILIVNLVLFAPIRYKSSGTKSEDVMFVQAFVTFCNPMIRVKLIYDQKFYLHVRIFGIKVFKIPVDPAQEDTRADVVALNSVDTVQEREQTSATTDQEQIKLKPDITTQKDEQEKERKATKIVKVIKYYHVVWGEEKKTVYKFLNECIKMIKRILPTKCVIDASYGTGNADTTGYIYAVYCAMQPYISKEIVLEPIWIEKTLNGAYTLKGKIRLIHLLILVLKLFIQKEYHTLYTKIRGGLALWQNTK